MSYAVKEIFLTLQGEGGQAGRAAVFCRFAGCNLWSGREEDRAGPEVAAGEAAEDRLVVLTGGEPLLQADPALVDALHARGFSIALETNGSLPCPPGVDWICVSPKGQVPVVQRTGQELKLVFPQPGVDPAALESWDWRLSVQTHKTLGIP